MTGQKWEISPSQLEKAIENLVYLNDNLLVNHGKSISICGGLQNLRRNIEGKIEMYLIHCRREV
jgi:hypothetical protein